MSAPSQPASLGPSSGEPPVDLSLSSPHSPHSLVCLSPRRETKTSGQKRRPTCKLFLCLSARLSSRLVWLGRLPPVNDAKDVAPLMEEKCMRAGGEGEKHDAFDMFRKGSPIEEMNDNNYLPASNLEPQHKHKRKQTRTSCRRHSFCGAPVATGRHFFLPGPFKVCKLDSTNPVNSTGVGGGE